MAARSSILCFSLALISVVHVGALNESCTTQTGASTGGLLDVVTSMQNTVGYAGLDSIVARQAKEIEGEVCTLRMVKMINKDGQVVSPSARGAQAAVHSKSESLLESSCPGFGLCSEVSDGEGADVWPISTLTYIIVPTNATDWEEGCDKMKTLYDYVKWVLENGGASDIAQELSMATMPPVVAENAKKILDHMHCNDTAQGLHRVKDRATRSNTLQGSGSSLQGNLQTRLTNEYFQQNFVSVSYTATGSGSGMRALRAREFDFSGSDSILDMEDPEFIRRGMRMVPVFAAAVGVVFNVANVEELVLPRPAMDRLFTGDAFSWRDPAILAANPAVAHLLPDHAVIRVVRASKSGTTSALTKALYAFAGHPTPTRDVDYSVHVLGGSSFPDWPPHPWPYPGETTCRYKECVNVVCDPGYYLDASAEGCRPCPLGSFSGVRGQESACEACPAGSYTNTEGNTRCVQCDDQKYQDQAGQQACKPCPLNSRRFSAEVLRDGVLVREQTPGVAAGECKCVEGYWLPASVGDPGLGGQDCVQCPDGAECRGYPEHIPQPKRGFWGRQDHPHEMFECAVDACVGSFECKAGHQGRKCAGPVEGYFTIGELWFFECPAPGFRAVFTLFGVLCVVAVWVLTHHLSLKYDAFAIAFLFFQIIGIISKFRLRWHPNLNIVLIALRVINFDVDFFGPQCLFPGWDAASAFYTQLFLPLIVVALYALFFYAKRRLRRLVGAAETKPEPLQAVIENKGYLRSPAYSSDDLGIYLSGKGTTYLLMMFHTLAARAFAVFVCETDADGAQHYMVTAPTLQCWTTKHIVMVAAAVVYILTVICGVPLLLLWRMLQVQRDDKLCDFTVTVRYWFLYNKFRVSFPYWELVLLLRRFVLVLILVFVPVSMLQAALALAALKAFLCLHLTHSPFKDTRVGLLDSFGLCCSMAYAVCGMLFFPSLDDTLECVGSVNLDEIGEQCSANRELKQEASVVLLLLLLFTLLAALYISFRDIQEKVYSAAAAKKIEADKRWYGKDKLFKALRSMPKDKRRGGKIAGLCSMLAEESRTHLASLRSETSALLGSARDATRDDPAKARKTLRIMQRMRAQRSERRVDDREEEAAEAEASRGFAGDPRKLNLCDMLAGDCLHHWHASLSTLSEKELAVRLMFADKTESESARQELAYMDLELWVPAFAVRHERVSGYFSNNELGAVLRELVEGVPELVDFLAVAQDGAVESLSNFVNAYAIFARTRRPANAAFHPLVSLVHRGQVVHWLMQGSAEEQAHFRALFRALTLANAPPRTAPAALRRLLGPLAPRSTTTNKVQPQPEITGSPVNLKPCPSPSTDAVGAGTGADSEKSPMVTGSEAGGEAVVVGAGRDDPQLVVLTSSA